MKRLYVNKISLLILLSMICVNTICYAQQVNTLEILWVKENIKPLYLLKDCLLISYTLNNNTYIKAINPKDGSSLWNNDINQGSSEYINNLSIIINSNYLYALKENILLMNSIIDGSKNKLICVNILSGSILYELLYSGDLIIPTIIDDKFYYCKDAFIIRSLQTGKVIAEKIIKYKGNALKNLKLLLINESYEYWATPSFNGNMFCIDSRNNQVVWKNQSSECYGYNDWSTKSPLIANNKLYYIATDCSNTYNYLIVLNKFTGELQEEIPDVFSLNIYDNNIIIQKINQKKIEILMYNTVDNSEIWKVSTKSSHVYNRLPTYVFKSYYMTETIIDRIPTLIFIDIKSGVTATTIHLFDCNIEEYFKSSTAYFFNDKCLITFYNDTSRIFSFTLPEVSFIRAETNKYLLLRLDNIIANINDNTVIMKYPPEQLFNRVYLYVDAIAYLNNLNFRIEQQKVFLYNTNFEIEFVINSNVAFINKKPLKIDPNNSYVTPIVRNNKVYLPIRFVFEKLGKTINFDSETRSIIVTYQP